MTWLESMHRIRALKLSLARLDPRRGMPIAPPPGAPEAAIAGVERRLGMPLPPSYRAMLALHDGWPQLFAGAGLLGVRALARGSFIDVARMVIGDCDVGAPAGAGEAVPALDEQRDRRGVRDTLIPFGIDAPAETVFAWDVESRRADGELDVIFWTNDIGLRLESFPDLLELLGDMLAAELDDRRRRAAEQAERAWRLPPAVAPRTRPRAVAVPLVPAQRPLARGALAG